MLWFEPEGRNNNQRQSDAVEMELHRDIFHASIFKRTYILSQCFWFSEPVLCSRPFSVVHLAAFEFGGREHMFARLALNVGRVNGSTE